MIYIFSTLLILSATFSVVEYLNGTVPAIALGLSIGCNAVLLAVAIIAELNTKDHE